MGIIAHFLILKLFFRTQANLEPSLLKVLQQQSLAFVSDLFQDWLQDSLDFLVLVFLLSLRSFLFLLQFKHFL